jgi:hypothetical protein
MRTIAVVFVTCLPAAVMAAQTPAVQNAIEDIRPVTALARDVATAASGSEPAWVGWQVPIVAGDLDLCSTWTNDDRVVRGSPLEEGSDSRTLSFIPSTPPVRLEAGSRLVILARVVDGTVGRLRTFTGDCPLDAGGRRLTWLSGVTPAASIDYLKSLVSAGQMPPAVRRVSDSAIAAIAWHQDAAAGPVLVEFASRDDPHTRDVALQWLGRSRGPFGFGYLTRTLATATEPLLRRQLALSLARTREDGTAAALLALARSDSDERVRADALYTYAQLAPSPSDVTALIQKEPAKQVRNRGISGLLRRPSGDAVVPLIALARTATDAELKKEIVGGLSRADDPQAVRFLEELVKR